MNFHWNWEQAFFFAIGFAIVIAVVVSLALLVNIIVTLFWLCKRCLFVPKSPGSLPTTWTYEPVPAPRRTVPTMPAPSAPFQEEENIYTELTISRF